MKLFDLRNFLGKELIVLRQFPYVERVDLTHSFDLIFKAWLLEVLRECLFQPALVLSHDSVSQVERLLE